MNIIILNFKFQSHSYHVLLCFKQICYCGPNAINSCRARPYTLWHYATQPVCKTEEKLDVKYLVLFSSICQFVENTVIINLNNKNAFIINVYGGMFMACILIFFFDLSR